MGNYSEVKQKIINQEQVNPSFAALKASFDLFKVEMAKDFLSYEQVQEEVLHNLSDLSQDEHFLVFLLNELPFSLIYKEIKESYLNLELVWEKIVEIEKLPLQISGTYYTGENQAIVKSDKLNQVDILLDNKEHSVISSLNKLNIKEGFNFTAQLQKGSLYTYQGLIEISELDEKIKAIQTLENQETNQFSKFRKVSKQLSGIALSLAMAVSLVGCGANPEDEDNRGYPPPYNNSPDCLIRKASFYDRLSQLRVGMSEEQVDDVLDPERRLRKGNFKYSISYEIEGFDYSIPGVVTCEAVQLHFDSYWRFRTYTVKTYPL